MAKPRKTEGGTIRFVKVKRAKSERTHPNRPKRKPYRGQGRV